MMKGSGTERYDGRLQERDLLNRIRIGELVRDQSLIKTPWNEREPAWMSPVRDSMREEDDISLVSEDIRDQPPPSVEKEQPSKEQQYKWQSKPTKTRYTPLSPSLIDTASSSEIEHPNFFSRSEELSAETSEFQGKRNKRRSHPEKKAAKPASWSQSSFGLRVGGRATSPYQSGREEENYSSSSLRQGWRQASPSQQGSSSVRSSSSVRQGRSAVDPPPPPSLTTRRGRSPSPFSTSSRRGARISTRSHSPSFHRQGRNKAIASSPPVRRAKSPSLARYNTSGGRDTPSSPHSSRSRRDSNGRIVIKIGSRSRSPFPTGQRRNTSTSRSQSPWFRRGQSPSAHSSSNRKNKDSTSRHRSSSLIRTGTTGNDSHASSSRTRKDSRSRSPFTRHTQKTSTSVQNGPSQGRILNSGSLAQHRRSSTNERRGNGILRPSRYNEKKNPGKKNSTIDRSKSADRSRPFKWWWAKSHDRDESLAHDNTEVVVNSNTSQSTDNLRSVDTTDGVQENEVSSRQISDASAARVPGTPNPNKKMQVKTGQRSEGTSAPVFLKPQCGRESPPPSAHVKASKHSMRPSTLKRGDVSFRRMPFMNNEDYYKTWLKHSKSLSASDSMNDETTTDSSTLVSGPSVNHGHQIRALSEATNQIDDISGNDESYLDIDQAIVMLEYKLQVASDESSPSLSPEELGEILSALSKLRVYVAHREGNSVDSLPSSSTDTSKHNKMEFWLERLTSSMFGYNLFLKSG